MGVSAGGGGAPPLPPPTPASSSPPQPWGYQLVLSSGRTLFLSPGGPVTAAQPGAGPGSLNVTWPPAVFVDQLGAPVAAQPKGVAYTVYLLKGGFAAAGSAGSAGSSGGVATTACGLISWGEGGGPGAPLAVAVEALDAGWVEVIGLDSGAVYGLNVLAVCNAACMGSAAVAAEGSGGELGREAAERLRTAQPVEVGSASSTQQQQQEVEEKEGGVLKVHLGRGLQPGYKTQRVAYAPVSAQAGGGGSGAPTATSKALSAAAVAGIVFLLLVLGAGGYFGWRYWQSLVAGQVSQYERIDTGGSAMTTISVPAVASANWSGGSEEEGGAGGRGGMLASLKGMFGGSFRANGSHKPLANSADHSELDDRVQGFL